MAKVVTNGDVCVVIEARNIGFIKAVKDIASSELDGVEALGQETVLDALKSVPEGFVVKDVKTQLYENGKNIFVTITAYKG